MNSTATSPLSTADLYDAHSDTVQVCELQFRSFGKHESFHGPCTTLRCFEDHTPVLSVLQERGEGRVLVVDAGGSLRVGVMGDRLASIAAGNGWSGVVINGAIRDSAGIDPLDLGVKALGATARRGWAAGDSVRDITVSFGGMTFAPGAWLYADRDAVILSPTQLPLETPLIGV